MATSFILLSVNHESVPLEVREEYSLEESKLALLYDQLNQIESISESLILNTCNRLELYACVSDEHPENPPLSILSEFFEKDALSLLEHFKVRRGQQAIQHLIEVCAGLRSQIPGEVEIFGQVKNAYSASHKNGYTGKIINRVFQKGFQAAKLIRNTTRIGEGQINVANVAVELAAKIFGSLGKASTLSLGTGDIGEKTVKALKSRGVERLGVASRSFERAESVSKDWGGKPYSISGLASYLHEYDIVIASVGAEEKLIDYSMAKNAVHQRRDRPLFLIDLGLPRNIDPDCQELDNVFLYNLDDLAVIANENLKERKAAVDSSEKIASHRSQLIWESLLRRGIHSDA